MGTAHYKCPILLLLLLDHELLISKLTSIGCTEEPVKWFKSYLSDREQITNFKVKKSQSFIKMGVPQGSILGPLLFSIYVTSMSIACQTARVTVLC